MYDQKTIYDAVANVLSRECGVDPEQAQHVAKLVVERLSSEAVSELVKGQKGIRCLSPPERKVLDFVIRFIGDQEWPPTVQEIAAGVGRSKRTVRCHLLRLKEAKYITRTARQHRSIKVL